MRIELDVPEYSLETGISLDWEEGFTIKSRIENSSIVIEANREGLISLARHLLTLAQIEIPSNSHIHLDEYNSLENESCEIIIERI
ncbi:MAG TPA: hypothetical protein VH186_01780 [Chloroflexia bacterium]|nr:hypothetical protein [Chloroflexia bacterium]